MARDGRSGGGVRHQQHGAAFAALEKQRR
jgi:hypothetical protein